MLVVPLCILWIYLRWGLRAVGFAAGEVPKYWEEVGGVMQWVVKVITVGKKSDSGEIRSGRGWADVGGCSRCSDKPPTIA